VIRLIFMVVAFLMMVGAIISGLYFWGIDPLDRFNQLIGNAPSPKGDGSGAVVVRPPSYVDFGLLIVPVVQDREVRKQAEMILRLEVPFEKKEVVAQNLPRLQNAFLEDMMAFLPYRLLTVCDKVLVPGWVKDVTIEQSSLK
jgi:flagellar FliL protein